MTSLINAKTLINGYLKEFDWRVKENSNSPTSFGALNKYISGEVSKNYWLNEIYGEPIKGYYLSGDIHIHDLSSLTLYCCGFSLENILLKGVCGVTNIPNSSPASHFDSVLNQIANLITIFQNEIAGAVAFNSIDTMLAPFIFYDNLTEKQVKQSLQNFIYSINSNSRGGAEPAFTNLTLDVTPTKTMSDKYSIVGGKYTNKTYGEFQPEIDLFNKVFSELMIEGDSNGRPFAYPIITYNMGQRFDWNDCKNDNIFEMAGKYGYPYFANFGKHSELNEDDAKSMCCRLRLDLTELRKRNGGLFGSGDNTGSIGVVTINLPRIGYLANTEEEFFKLLDDRLEIASWSLELKRKFLEKEILNGGLLPAFSEYVGSLKNHFSTIGDIGKNEMCVNFLVKDILSPEGKAFSLKVGNYIKAKIQSFQIESGNLYNYEATPAEGTSYRLANADRIKFNHESFMQGEGEEVYYTNSCHIPVNLVTGLSQILDHQSELQIQYTGGTVIHLYLEGGISGDKAKQIIKTVFDNYPVPYISLSPITRYCETHGFVKNIQSDCPICHKKLDQYQRITGYIRPVKNFNIGKAKEFAERNQLNGNKI